MRIRNVDFPRPLLEAQQNGSLVIFAGAGVSIPPPSNYPNFDGLAARVAGGSLAREKEERVDHFLGRLKDHGVAVHQIVHRILSDESSRPNQLHKALLGLFTSPTKIRIVTTNFDLHFNSSLPAVLPLEPEPETYAAPALPLGSTFHGIVYLHGSVAKPADRLILTDSDFGSAYLTEGWATRFLQQLFLHNIILFVGYSHNDMVVDYLARGLTPESRSPKRYAITIAGNEAHWKRLGVIPITYPPTSEQDRHSALGPAIEGWVQLIRATALDHEERIRSIVQQPVSLDPDDQDYIEEACKDPSQLQFFTRHTDRTDWLRWAEGKGLLANIFSSTAAFSKADEQLAFWFAQNFTCEHSNDSLALVQRHNGQMSWLLWHHICLAFHQKKPTSDVVAKWVPVLLAAAPQQTNGDLLEYMLCARQLPDDEATVLLLVEYLTEIRPNLKKRRWPTEEEDVSIELSARGSEFWLKQAWHTILNPNLATIGERLLLILTSNIFRAYLLLRSFGVDYKSWDQLSASRAQIESAAYGGPPDTLDLIIDIACEALRSLIASHPERANFFIDYWFASNCRLLRRMAVFGVAKSNHWTTEQKIKWILENKLIHAFGYKPEVFLVLKENFGDASPRLRARILKVATAGPDVPDKRTKDYEIYNILNWLSDSAPRCHQTTATFNAFKNTHKGFGSQEHPELDWWVGPTLTGGPSSPLSEDAILALTPDELCTRLKAIKHDDLIGPSREGLLGKVQSAVSKKYEWSALLVKKLIADRTWERDLWRAILGGWLGADLQEPEWVEVLTNLLENPEIREASIYESSALLEHGIKKDSHPIPTSRLDLATQVAEKLWQICDAPHVGRADEPDDWLEVAINHPAGNLILFLLRLISELRKTAKDEWHGIPDQQKQFLATVVSGESYSAGIGRVIIASQVFFLFTSDQEWTIQNVLPLFDFTTKTERTVQAWHGFLTWGSWNQEFLPHLMKLFIAAFSHLHSAFNEKQRQLFCEYLAGIACRGFMNPLEDGWLQQFQTAVTTKEREMWAGSMSGALQGIKPAAADSIWKSWIGRYWQFRIDGVPSPLDPSEVRHMNTWPIRFKEYFPDAAAKVYKSPTAAQTKHSFIYEELNTSDLLTLHPAAAARFVLFLLENRVCEMYGYFDPVVKIVRTLCPLTGTNAVLLKICEELAEQGYPGARSLRDEVNGTPENGPAT